MADDSEKDTEWRARAAAGSGQARAAQPPAAAPAPTAAPAYSPPPARPVDGLAVTALVLGIVGVLLCWLPFVGGLLSILAIIFGGIGLSRKISTGMAVTGLVLGIITLLINIVFIVGVIASSAKVSL